MQALSIKH